MAILRSLMDDNRSLMKRRRKKNIWTGRKFITPAGSGPSRKESQVGTRPKRKKLNMSRQVNSTEQVIRSPPSSLKGRLDAFEAPALRKICDDYISNEFQPFRALISLMSPYKLCRAARSARQRVRNAPIALRAATRHVWLYEEAASRILKLAKFDQVFVSIEKSEIVPRGSNMSKAKILVVDDEPNNQRILTYAQQSRVRKRCHGRWNSPRSTGSRSNHPRPCHPLMSHAGHGWNNSFEGTSIHAAICEPPRHHPHRQRDDDERIRRRAWHSNLSPKNPPAQNGAGAVSTCSVMNRSKNSCNPSLPQPALYSCSAEIVNAGSYI